MTKGPSIGTKLISKSESDHNTVNKVLKPRAGSDKPYPKVSVNNYSTGQGITTKVVARDNQ